MAAHDEVAGAILRALRKHGGELRLLARLVDPVLGNPSDREVYFFVPDLHLVSLARRRRFASYGFNHEDREVLADVLEELAVLRSDWRDEGGHKLVTFQLGDFLDLWREFPRKIDAAQLDGEHRRIRDLLYRGRFRGGLDLRATMLLGNHDTKGGRALPEVTFQFRAFNWTEQGGLPFLFATHGDAYDVVERLVPDPIAELAVYLIDGLTPVNKYDLGTWAKAAEKNNKKLSEMNRSIMKPLHELELVEAAPVVVPGEPLPERLLQETDDIGEVRGGRFTPFYEAFLQASPESANVRLMVTGHSHQASLSLYAPADGSRPMVFLDAGGWIERCAYPLSETETADEPCAQLAVVNGNDARIYQLRVGVA